MTSRVQITLVLVGILAVLGLIVWLGVGKSAVAPGTSDGTTTDMASTSDDGTSVSPTASSTDGQGSAPGGAPHTKAPAARVSGFTVTFPYADAARNETYYVPWAAPRGTKATVTVVQNGQKLSVVPSCEDMRVVPGVLAYCAFTPPPLGPKQSADGFALQLTVYDSGGAQIATAQTAPFRSTPSLSEAYIPHKNVMYGWSVRHPQSWTVNDTVEHAAIARNPAAAVAPSGSDEAFSIESCSLAREECVNRKDAYIASGQTYSATLGGKRTLQRITEDSDGFIRTDMFERLNILYFVTVRSLMSDGTVRSPYVREALASFTFDTPNKTITTYGLDGLFSAGALFVEKTDNIISYVRLYTATPSCKSEASTGTFIKKSGSRFVFMQGACRIDGRASGNEFTVSEEDCETFHADECTFEGTYTPAH